MRKFWPFNKKKGMPDVKKKQVPDQDRKTGPGTGVSVHDAVDTIRERNRKMKEQLDQL